MFIRSSSSIILFLCHISWSISKLPCCSGRSSAYLSHHFDNSIPEPVHVLQKTLDRGRKLEREGCIACIPWIWPAFGMISTSHPGHISLISGTPVRTMYASCSLMMNLARSGRSGWEKRFKFVYWSINIHINFWARLKFLLPSSCDEWSRSNQSQSGICCSSSRNFGDSSSASRFFQLIACDNAP